MGQDMMSLLVFHSFVILISILIIIVTGMKGQND